MPRRKEAKKDAATCEKLRRGGSSQRPANVRMGQPRRSNVRRWALEYIERLRRTQGSETSQYLEEKKAKAIP